MYSLLVCCSLVLSLSLLLGLSAVSRGGQTCGEKELSDRGLHHMMGCQTASHSKHLLATIYGNSVIRGG